MKIKVVNSVSDSFPPLPQSESAVPHLAQHYSSPHKNDLPNYIPNTLDVMYADNTVIVVNGVSPDAVQRFFILVLNVLNFTTGVLKTK